ncbi:epidermal growth factor-like protein 7 isoform X5 [Cynocephalus volans]|uniref:epidermal growth factor-like protein 7 isoform X5 n=1 Tax=Cynocephalus volans TaxID=110931 RepID=UPI002FC75A3C
MGTGPAAHTEPSIGLPTDVALGQPLPGLTMPAAPAGRGPPGSPEPAEQQYASRLAGTEGAVSSQAAATALQGGRVPPARQALPWLTPPFPADVDECSSGGGGCPQRCVNTAGSYWCQCWEGHSPPADRTLCLPRGGPPRVAPTPTIGVDSAVKEEVQRLRSRVDVLEQKLQLVLAPLHSLASRALEHGLPDPGSLLAHSFQQLDRIDSLSEQISFLEEQLGSCSCKKEM